MSPIAEVLMRKGLDVVENLILPRLVPSDKLAVLRHYERVFGEQAAKLQTDMEHTQRMRGVSKNR